jgi:hypothetical protein
VNDAVPDSVGAAEAVDRGVELQRIGLRLGRLEILGPEQLIFLI